MTEQVNMPKLRFGEFDQEWASGSLATICNKIQDGNYGAEYPKSEELLEFGIPFLTSKALGGSGIINVSKIDYISKEKHASLKKAQLQLDDVLFTNRGSNVGVISYVDERIAHGNIGPQLTLLRANDLVTPKFLKTYLQTRLFQKQVASQDSGSAMNFFGIKTTSKFKVSVPQITEQQKIASFLSKVDKKIELLSEKKDKLTEYNKGVMQQLFNGKWQEQDGQMTFVPPTLRFKADDGSEFPDWKEMRGGELFEPISNKNHSSDLPVLAITQNQGAVPRDQINYKVSVSESSVASYKVVEKGDFIISLRSFQGGIEYSEYTGICSPAYVILRAKKEISDYFFKLYLKTYPFIVEMQKRLEGIRDGKIISYKYFSEISMPYPSITEQEKIVQFLSTLDQKIELTNIELEKSKEWKKGLLQQMFV